jgi:hypothetical protein
MIKATKLFQKDFKEKENEIVRMLEIKTPEDHAAYLRDLLGLINGLKENVREVLSEVKRFRAGNRGRQLFKGHNQGLERDITAVQAGVHR